MSRFLRVMVAGVVCGLGPLGALVALGGCGSVTRYDDPASSPAVDAAVERRRLAQPYRPDASCEVVIDTPEVLPSPHVEIPSDVVYNSNPPSSGPHYPIWAAFQEYDQPVDRRYWVHDLEHGAVVLLYRCSAKDQCPDIATKIRGVKDLLPQDPICTEVKNRIILTPDPLLDVPVAAAAWGWTYKAQCVDTPTLGDFAREHYGQGTEAVCANGQGTF